MSAPETFPLSSTQQEIWADQRLHTGIPLYNLGFYLDLEGRLDRARMHQALEALVRESDGFRLILTEGRQPQQYAMDAERYVADHFTVGEYDFTVEGADVRRVADWMQARLTEPFVLYGEPLCRFWLLRLSPQRHHVLFICHHLIGDGYSSMLFNRRLAEIYNALAADEPLPPFAGTAYADWVADEQRYRNSARYEKGKAYWLKQLAPLPDPVVAEPYLSEFRDGAVPSQVVPLRLAWSRYRQLQALATRLKASAFHVFLAILQIYFARLEPGRDFVVGTPLLNRGTAKFRHTMGLFMSVAPLWVPYDARMSVEELITRIRVRLQANYRHHRYPLGDLRRDLKLLSRGRRRLFNLLLSYEPHDNSTRYGEASCRMRQMFNGYTQDPLALTVCEFHSGCDVELVFEYSRGAFTEGEFGRLVERFDSLIDRVVDAPGQPVGRIDVLPAAERAWLLEQARGEATAGVTSISTAFAHACRDHADAVAIIQGEVSLTYRELAQLSNHLAHFLLESGANGSVVLLLLDRSIEAVAALLACLNSGAVFLPLDGAIPAERLNAIVAESRPSVVVTQRDQVDKFAAIPKRLLLRETLREQTAGFPATFPEVVTRPSDLAYLIYTSGSSGRPKAVMVERDGLDRRITWLLQALAIDASDRMSHVTRLCFDPAIYEALLPLLKGARLVLAGPGPQRPEALVQLLHEHAITVALLVPSLLQRFLGQHPEKAVTRLRAVHCGGETLHRELRQQFFRQFPGVALWNFYGPTEATILATAWRCRPGDEGATPIGRPVGDTSVHLLDAHLEPVPVGAVGEICIGGPGVARGYLHRERLTRERFVPDPFAAEAGARLYRTGDLGRLRDDGALEYLGRVDRQLKVRGYRIEPGEIEAALCRHGAVAEAAVGVQPTEGPEVRLVAWYVPAADAELTPAELRAHLQRYLPDYMVPGRLVAITALPLNTNEKVDFHALLAALPAAGGAQATDEDMRPRDGVERDLAGIWRRTLGLAADVGREDDFFELGGDSLAVLEVMTQIERRWGMTLPLGQLFAQTTLHRQAAAIEHSGGQATGAVRALSFGDPAAATTFYCVASGEGDRVRLQRLASLLTPDCRVVLLLPDLQGGGTVEIPALASEYARFVADDVERHRVTHWCVGGFSVGGVVAFELARQFEAQGQPACAAPILIDTLYPGSGRLSAIALALLRTASRIPLLADAGLRGRSPRHLLEDAVLIGQVEALASYRVRPLKQGEIILMRSQALRWFERFGYGGWGRSSASGTQRIAVRGHHSTIFDPEHIQGLADTLLELLCRWRPHQGPRRGCEDRPFAGIMPNRGPTRTPSRTRAR